MLNCATAIIFAQYTTSVELFFFKADQFGWRRCRVLQGRALRGFVDKFQIKGKGLLCVMQTRAEA